MYKRHESEPDSRVNALAPLVSFIWLTTAIYCCFLPGSGKASAAWGLAEGWQSANSPRELVALAVPRVRTSDAPHLDVAGQSCIKGGEHRKFKELKKSSKKHKRKRRLFTSPRILCSPTDISSVNMMDAPKVRTNLESQCPPFWFVYLDLEDLLETAGKKCVRTSIDRIVVWTPLRNDFIIEKMVGRKYLGWGYFSMYREQTLPLCVWGRYQGERTVDNLKLVWCLFFWQLNLLESTSVLDQKGMYVAWIQTGHEDHWENRKSMWVSDVWGTMNS